MTLPSTCCLQASEIKDATQGRMIQLAGLGTYEAGQPFEKSRSIVLMFTDVFGLKLNNAAVIADKLAAQTGFTVLIPDVFEGGAVTPSKIAAPGTTGASKDLSWWDWLLGKLRAVKLLAMFLPWLYSHRPGLKRDHVLRLVDALPTQAKVGVSGYCYGAGALWPALVERKNRIAACFLAHPSFLKPDQLVQAPTRLSIAFAEDPDDPYISPAQARDVEASLKKREEFPSEVVIYPNVKHGFATRPVPETRASFDKALNQAAQWFSHYLG